MLSIFGFRQAPERWVGLGWCCDQSNLPKYGCKGKGQGKAAQFCKNYNTTFQQRRMLDMVELYREVREAVGGWATLVNKNNPAKNPLDPSLPALSNFWNSIQRLDYAVEMHRNKFTTMCEQLNMPEAWNCQDKKDRLEQMEGCSPNSKNKFQN